MTADLDLSPEAVERLLSLPRLYIDHEGDICCERPGDNFVAYPADGNPPPNSHLNQDMWEAIPQFQALACALAAELAAARKALAEAKAAWLAFEGATVSGDHFAAVDRIRSALGLSVAADDEADAIRSAARRANIEVPE